MKWKNGRQGTDYQVLTLWSRWNFDIHIIKCKPNTSIPPHNDFVHGKKHHRINILLTSIDPVRYGTALFSKPQKRWWRLTYFRPDLLWHWARPTNNGWMMLSVGWITSY